MGKGKRRRVQILHQRERVKMKFPKVELKSHHLSSLAILIVGLSLIGTYGYLSHEKLKLEKANLVLEEEKLNLEKQEATSKQTEFRGEQNLKFLENISAIKERKDRETKLNFCLQNAKSEQEDTNGKLLEWANGEGKDKGYDLTGAFDSIEKKYEQDREDCFNKYP